MLIYSPKPIINPIARAYFDRVKAAGGDVFDKTNVNNFINGFCVIVPPQFWICWLLRSTQNVGTGTRGLSVGGFDYNGATTDATLTGRPIWTNNGILMTGTMQVLFPVKTLTSDSFGMFAVINTLAAGDVFLSDGGANYNVVSWGGNFNLSIMSFDGGTNGVGNGTRPINSFGMLGVTWTRNTTNGFVGYNNGNIAGQKNSANTPAAFGNSYRLQAGGGTNISPFVLNFIKYNPSSYQIKAIYDLYKSTVGQGLGLP